jgi:hypothetical protein
MRQNESAITIIALALGLGLTLTLVFGNFSVAYLVKLLSEGRVPLGNAFFVFAVTAANLTVLVFLAKAWFRAIRGSVSEDEVSEARVLETATQVKRQDNYQRWQEAKEKVLGLAQTHSSFTLQEVMTTTQLDRSDSEYLLDQLLTSDLLSVYQEDNDFKYRLK